jgi:hypothetical protein
MSKRPRHHILTTDQVRKDHAEYTYCDKVGISPDNQGVLINRVNFVLPSKVEEERQKGQVKFCTRCLGEFHWDSD